MSINDIKKSYTIQEWERREDYYTKACARIVIPEDPTSKDIMRIESEIDKLLTEALFDLANIKRKTLDYKMKMQLAEKEAFVLVKNGQVGNIDPSKKLTENEVKGVVVTYLKSAPFNGTSADIYTIYQNTEYRFAFIESVVKILSEKKSALVADSGMLKIENTVTGVKQQ